VRVRNAKASQAHKIAGGTFLGIILILVISLFYIPVHSHSGRFIPFSDNWNFAGGGKWSLDGRWFAAAPLDSSYAIIQLLSPNGESISTLHTGCDIVLDQLFSWSPDGRLSCFSGSEPATLIMLDLDSNGQVKKTTQVIVPLTPRTLVADFQWNPHHFWLATIADKIAGENSPTLYITDLQGRNLISPISINGENLAWSPDGQTLALLKEDGNIDLINVQEAEIGKLVLKRRRTLLARTATFENIAWSPSGHWLVCRHGTYESEDYLFLLATDGSGRRVKITSSYTNGQLTSPAWSPDGKQLIVSTVFIADNMLMSLNMVEILAEKGIKP
jgi:Tol biopolymer transport system component